MISSNFPRLNLTNWKRNVLILIVPFLIFLQLPRLWAEGRITIEPAQSPKLLVITSPTPVDKTQSAAAKTREEQVAHTIVSTIADLYEGKEINKSNLVSGLNKILRNDMDRKIENIADPFIQSNVVLQTISQLNEAALKKALAKEFRKRFENKLSKEQANLLATQVILHGFSAKPLEQILSEGEIDNNTLQIIVADPENPVKHILLALAQYKPAAERLGEGKKLSLLFVMNQELSSEQKIEIENQAGGKISAALLTELEMIKENRLVVSALDRRISRWKDIKSFDELNLIIPKRLMSNLSLFLKLPKNSYLRKTVIQFIDELFNSTPPMRIGDENFEKTRHAISLIAHQA